MHISVANVDQLSLNIFKYCFHSPLEGQLVPLQAKSESHVLPSPGNYPQALEDFQECLALQLKHLPPHSRLLAETHYHVATTLCYMDQYSQAIQHYNSSIKVIEARLGKRRSMFRAAAMRVHLPFFILSAGSFF